jgi:hypothetical protein
MPTGYAMRTLGYADRQLLFTTYTKSAKVQNMRADPSVACVVLAESQPEKAWVSIRGTAVIHQASPAEVEALIPASSSDPRVPDAMVAKVRDRLTTGKRCIVRVTIDDIVCSAGLSEGDDAAK